MPRVMKSNQDLFSEDSIPLKGSLSDNSKFMGSLTDLPTADDLPATLIRLFKNKLLMFNILSGIFYILGASAYITFISKYLEVQFHKSAADATIISGFFEYNILPNYKLLTILIMNRAVYSCWNGSWFFSIRNCHI